MMVGLPSLPNQELLADLCREAAQREGVEPQVIEKDFYLTRLIWAFAQSLGDHLLLKSRTRRLNVARIDRVRASLHEVDELVGVRPEFPAGQLTDKAAHCEWRLVYPSEFGRQSIKLEVGIRPLFEPGRRVSLRQLIADPLLGSYENAYGFALSADEARAEKVRAAYTREAIRDFYDLERLRSLGVDLSSGRFVALVDRKLAELRAAPLSRQPPRVGMTARRHALLAASLRTELPSVLRANAPPFDLDDALDSLEQVWAPLRQS
jgi:predicted nucleotidyltransferase component of viral defense system